MQLAARQDAVLLIGKLTDDEAHGWWEVLEGVHPTIVRARESHRYLRTASLWTLAIAS
jgi:hypothetical protein